jgi:tetratricopeptide (TPR) repeat protein
MIQTADWQPAFVCIAGGIALGIILVWRLSSKRRAAARIDGEIIALRDLIARRDVLIGRLQELQERSEEGDADQHARERSAVEIECATVLREIDRRAKKRPDGEAPTTPAGRRSPWIGFLWGVTATVSVIFLYTAIPGPERRDQRTPVEQASEVELLRRALQQDPDNLETRLALAKQHLVHHEMAATMEQTQYVLARRPGDPLALIYEALVRYTIGETEKARSMLREALKTNPRLLEGWIHLIFIEVREGRTQEARRLVDEASRVHPEQAGMLKSLLSEFGVPEN